MQRCQPRRMLVLATSIASLLAAGALPTVTSAGAQIAFAPCPKSNSFACGHLTVPLDRSGLTPGTITLAIRRHRAAVGEARTAIVALAGGPGQPALPFAEQFAELLGPIAATRDLIVFDQRGIGLSDPLACHAFERPDLYSSIAAVLEACSGQLGARRSFYTTADTVADIEAIRVAGGYEKLVLYGTSYGTKVAEQYAQDHPDRVEALVLDSVVPPNGPEPLSRSTFAAVPRILRQLCAARACAGITADPVGDLEHAVARMGAAPLRAQAIGEHGGAHAVTLSSGELLALLLTGDFSPLLRAEFITALAALAHGDPAPLARLVEAAGHAEGEGEDFDTPLYYATTCEEQSFPWSRAGTPAARVAQALATARALPASAFAPFTAANALELSDVRACARWQFSSPFPPVDDAPLPDVPSLILSGAADLRTPTANAREVAAQIPDSHLLVVPLAGHSVLTDEPTACASDALQALFATGDVKPCPPLSAPAILRPPPLPPLRVALVTPTKGYRGLPGRTLQTLALTLGDLIRQLALRLTLGGVPEAPGTAFGVRLGGLRSGWAELTGRGVKLHGYSYVRGVTVSGAIGLETEDLHVGGPAAAHGTLRGVPHRSLAGMLGGRHVVLPASSLRTTAIVVEDARESSHRGTGDSAALRAARVLAGLLGGGRR